MKLAWTRLGAVAVVLLLLPGCSSGQPNASPSQGSSGALQVPTVTTTPMATTPMATTSMATTPMATTPMTTTSMVTTAGEAATMPESTDIDKGLAPYVNQAVQDLAGRLGIGPADITTVSAAVVVWSDAALGCPAPGMQYAQVLSDGSLIVLKVADVVYRYHSGDSTPPFLCVQ